MRTHHTPSVQQIAAIASRARPARVHPDMKLAATLALALSLPSLAHAAVTGKPRRPSDAARAAATRVTERDIPKIVKYAKPKKVDLATIVPTAPAAATADPTMGLMPDAAANPPLTPEELAADVVEVTPRSLHTPQVGTWFSGATSTFGRLVGVWLDPRHDDIMFGVSAQWIGGHPMLVECAGLFAEPHHVFLMRLKDESDAEGIGMVTVDLIDQTLAFLVPSTKMGDWKQLGVMIRDADGTGALARMDKCTFTRL